MLVWFLVLFIAFLLLLFAVKILLRVLLVSLVLAVALCRLVSPWFVALLTWSDVLRLLRRNPFGFLC